MTEPAPTRRSLRDAAAAAAAVAAAADVPVATESDARADAEASHLDEFEAAARLFSFTGEMPVATPEPSEPAEAVAEPTQPVDAAHVPARAARIKRAVFTRVAAGGFSIGVIGVVGLLAVGMTTPLGIVASADGTDATATALVAGSSDDMDSETEDVQAYVVPAEVAAAPLDRPETYDTATTAQLAFDSGISNFSNTFVNSPDSAIQWPFAVGVPITYGFGMRSGRMHEGVDFTPGAGAPIQAIADGVVSESTDSGGAYGVDITIDHVIDGEHVSSHYAHMQYGSRQVQVGDHVTVGEVIGHTGNTGRSFGAHTHFEILANGKTPIDPLPWLREHAGG